MGKDTQEGNGEERKERVDTNRQQVDGFNHMGKGMVRKGIFRVIPKEVEKGIDQERREMGDQYFMGHVTNAVCLDTHREDVHHWERDSKGNAMDVGEWDTQKRNAQCRT